ncbi:hypothetical protein AA103196_0195 [Ameyamaea chiangmaiensis NBRC 103196]|nr:hypothetical protein AA103196_0195 [Ameyamaea chiangmaiensis NBRC 103196]
MEMAGRHPNTQIHIACTTQAHLDYARYLASFYPDTNVQFDLLRLPSVLRKRVETHGPNALSKILSLAMNKKYFSSFQAIVVPERTSLYLRRMGLRGPRLIWTRHGAGDRAIGFARDVREFDFVLLSGRKVERRLLADGSLRPGHYVTGIYAKFDMVQRMESRPPQLFDNTRPTILYNPHFNRALSSWPRFGLDTLDFFAEQTRFNVIFAPHYRLFDQNRELGRRIMRRYAKHGHMIIDPGSTRSIDMTYTRAADLYLGDVSSQIAEFLIKPRPCLFLNSHAQDWEDNPNYQFWNLGQVLTDVDRLDWALERAFIAQPQFLQRQREYIRETFEFEDEGPTAPVGADAIVHYLRETALNAS